MRKILNTTTGDIGSLGFDCEVIKMDVHFALNTLYPILKIEDDSMYDDDSALENKVIVFFGNLVSYMENNNIPYGVDVVVDVDPFWIKYFIESYTPLSIFIPIWNEHHTVVKRIINIK